MEFKNKLMVAGPAEMEEDVMLAGARHMAYNRTPEFSQFLLELEKKLQSFFKTKNDVYIISSSGTGAMEAAIVNLLSPGDDVVILSGGTFGQRWYDIASRYKINCNIIKVLQGESINPKIIKEKIADYTKAVFVTANETSTGTVIDLENIGKGMKDSNAILVVDAISSLGADILETDKWSCDVVIASSQKALALPPGLSFITISEKAWRLIEESKIPKYYFDLKSYKENLQRGQTPFTPPISLLYQLDVRLEKILKIGLNDVTAKQKEKSLYLQKGLSLLGLKTISQNPSNGVVGILFPPEINAFYVIQRLREEFGIEITPSYGTDKSRVARIGLFGNLTLSDIDTLLDALRQLLQRLYQNK